MGAPNRFTPSNVFNLHVAEHHRRHPGRGVRAPHNVEVPEHWRRPPLGKGKHRAPAKRRNPFNFSRANPFDTITLAFSALYGLGGSGAAYALNKFVLSSVKDPNALDYFDDAGKTTDGSTDTGTTGPSMGFYTFARWGLRALLGGLAATEFGDRFGMAHAFNGALNYPTASEVFGYAP